MMINKLSVSNRRNVAFNGTNAISAPICQFKKFIACGRFIS